MTRSSVHPIDPDTSFDGGDLHCGNGLLLLIRRHIDPLSQGQCLEIIASDPTVDEELRSWCRLTKNELISVLELENKRKSFLVSKGAYVPTTKRTEPEHNLEITLPAVKAVNIPEQLPQPGPAPELGLIPVMGIGSWPRPPWMMRTLSDYLSGRLSREDFDNTADDAVRLCVDAQLASGVDVVSDGEQRRDNYASFVGNILDNCQLVPLTDLLPMVEHPEEFEKELDSLDVPADKVRHPVVFGPLGRSASLLKRDLDLVKSIVSDKPIKLALPGPYLLTRMMWMDCIVNKVYATREELAKDIVRVLREEIHYLLADGASIIQLDEPVLSEVVYSNNGGPKNKRSFMCGALSERKESEQELAFATELINSTVAGIPPERTGLHICRGNWTTDESVALSGSYEPLLPVLQSVKVGHLFLEYCTERAGSLKLLSKIPDNIKVGVGMVNPKSPQVESVEEILARAKEALKYLAKDKLMLVPDCGFATFADNPVCNADNARTKLKNMVEAAEVLRND
ncbi:MAG: 5-methyltetrahydropteroyltriglutamate--homocysteine methyltransferase [Candidatus Obscuribacterales bacterium]|nr:5-methyltetrahydropteroyltriglutamate--homocysteine methyltransferase [Candidatus Obscuribacterales bacterium]